MDEARDESQQGPIYNHQTAVVLRRILHDAKSSQHERLADDYLDT